MKNDISPTIPSFKRDQQVRVVLGKWQGATGVVLKASPGVGYWYLVQLDGQTRTEWIHRLHLRGLV